MLTTFSLTGFAQTFNLKFFSELSDTVNYHALEWMDADNDSLLDLIVFAEKGNGEELIFVFKHDTIGGPQFIGHVSAGMNMDSYAFIDYDGDNRLDIVVSGHRDGQPSTVAFLNKGDFVFEGVEVLASSGSLVSFADFDQDGFMEMVLSGTRDSQPYLSIFRRTISSWVLVHDSINVEAQAIEAFDFDGDSDVDFVVSARDEQGSPVLRAFYNKKNFYFTAEDLTPSVFGRTNRADVNHDGNFDILISGKNDNTFVGLTLINTAGRFSVGDTLLANAHDAKMFAADFNSDGYCDINVYGILESGDTLNRIFRENTYAILPHKHMLTQRFGDYDRDGDLDILQLFETPAGSYNILVYQNKTPTENLSPGQPLSAVSAMIFNRFFLYWEKPLDDHTPNESLTYDVIMSSTGRDIMTGQFDLFNGRRLSVSHGNNGTSNYVLLRTYRSGPMNFNVQAVDNALHAGPVGICRGVGGGVGGGNVCHDEIETVSLDACKNELITLTADSKALWFSFSDGFLAETSAYEFYAERADTIFSMQRQISGCVLIKAYTMNVPETLTKVTETIRYACIGDVLHSEVEQGWTHVEWSSAAIGFLSNTDIVAYTVSAPDTLKVEVSDGSGCNIQRNTVIRISKPVIDATHDAYQILKGESVQLSVSGAETYQWQPASGLNDQYASHPVASPSKTTEYLVTGTDSVGCIATAKIIVVVEETAFVPNLFTPNHDGSNDVLKIYGLDQGRDFSFTIYNREGNTVFHTRIIAEAVSIGWDGTAGGVAQPSGVYYWNVKGETTTGAPLQLNGKESGSIVLLR